MISSTAREYVIVGIGELLWDMLPGDKRLGGAPANFAIHAGAMGARSIVISAAGQDTLGDEIFSTLASKRVSSDFIARSNHATGCVNVKLDADGNPSYDIALNAAWDHVELTPEMLTLAAACSAVCFGSLAQRNSVTRESVHQFLAATPAHCLRIFDINLRQDFYSKEIITDSLRAANVLKLNSDELQALTPLLELPRPTVEALRMLMHRYDLECIALTRGAAGSVMLTASELASCPGLPTVVRDTVGAGDAFTAAMAMGLLNKMPLDAVNAFAEKMAAFVCSQPGATPELPGSLIDDLYVSRKRASRLKTLRPANPGSIRPTELRIAE